MKQRSLTILLVAVLLGAVVSFFALNKPARAPEKDDSRQQPASSVETPAEATNKIAVQNYSFSPAAIKIPRGTSVIWTNNDTSVHTIVLGNADAMSEALNYGSSFSYVFDKTGTFTYHLATDPNHPGYVTVY